MHTNTNVNNGKPHSVQPPQTYYQSYLLCIKLPPFLNLQSPLEVDSSRISWYTVARRDLEKHPLGLALFRPQW